MSGIATSAIAVAGTLLGSLATYWIQHTVVTRQSDLTRAEKLRQERVDAITAFGGALHSYRKARMGRWLTVNRNDGGDLETIGHEINQLRTVVFERGFRVELLMDDPTLMDLGKAAVKEVEQIRRDGTEQEYEAVRAASREAIQRFRDASRDYVVKTR